MSFKKLTAKISDLYSSHTLIKALLTLLFITVFIFLGYKFLSAPKTMLEYSSLDIPSEEPIGPIVEDKIITQQFTSTESNLTGLSILFAIYGETKTSNISISIQEAETGVEIYSNTFNAKSLKDNSYKDFLFPEQKNSLGKDYLITITSDSQLIENAITIWSSKESLENSNSGLTINGIDYNKSLVFSLISTTNTPNFQHFIWIIIMVFLLLIILCLVYQKLGIKDNIAIICIYSAIFLFVVTKILIYINYVQGFPDELVHVSYIAYLEDTNKIIPQFSEMTLLHSSDTNPTSFADATNYLGHPPLYYHILRLSNGVTIEGDSVYINIINLRIASCIISLSAIILAFYIGYSRIKKYPILHLLYALILTSIPMFSYMLGAINNDTLSFLGATIFFLGALRFCEKKRDYKTFLLISLGICITLLSKVTAGLILILASIIFILVTMIKEKSLTILFNKNFFITLPIYILTVAYYIAIYLQVGGFQPSLASLNPKQFYESGFYVDISERVIMDFSEYLNYYWEAFFQTWTSWASHTSLLKDTSFFSIEHIALLSILWLPALLLLKIVRKNNNASHLLMSTYFSVLIVMIMQFVNARNSFLTNGYTGGYQSRYYFCIMVMFALSIVLIVQAFYKSDTHVTLDASIKTTTIKTSSTKKHFIKDKIIEIICIAFSGLLIYSDFIYFLFYYKDYINL